MSEIQFLNRYDVGVVAIRYEEHVLKLERSDIMQINQVMNELEQAANGIMDTFCAIIHVNRGVIVQRPNDVTLRILVTPFNDVPVQMFVEARLDANYFNIKDGFAHFLTGSLVDGKPFNEMRHEVHVDESMVESPLDVHNAVQAAANEAMHNLERFQ